MSKRNNILICPLEWGLGHAGRMIPLARRLFEMNNRIFIGAGEEHLSLFRREMPEVTLVSFSGFRPFYSGWLPQYFTLLLQTPVLLYHIISEHYRLKKIISEHKIDIVISDNRFGLWNKNLKSVYVTHMPVIPLPRALFFLEFFGVLLHRAIIKRYSFCFIPDLPGELNVSGRLSHGIKLPVNTRFIGILSRFTGIRSNENDSPVKFRHNTVILSGPEPQRGILKQKLTEVLKKKETPSVFLQGKPGNDEDPATGDNILFFNHLPAAAMKELITGSEIIITRSGYTTIMELISLNRSALIIPTPGQTEQEYLAGYLEKKGWFSTIPQKNINAGIEFYQISPGWTKDILEESESLLEKALVELSEDEQEEGRDHESKQIP